MKKYHKINTIWKRDSSTSRDVIIPLDWAIPEFEYLAENDWEFTEKLDGTNIRILWDGIGPLLLGKTDAASIPEPLSCAMGVHRTTGYFEDDGVMTDRFKRQFPGDAGEWRTCLFGEGVGARVHQGAGKYGDPKFVLFDVAVKDTQKPDHWWWLDHENVKDVAKKMGFEFSPVIGTGTLYDMNDMVKNGLPSAWGDFEAEGIVARPRVQMWSRRGERIVAKLKTKDFHDLKLHRERTIGD